MASIAAHASAVCRVTAPRTGARRASKARATRGVAVRAAVDLNGAPPGASRYRRATRRDLYPRRVDARENDERDEQPEREDQLERAVRFGRGPGRVLQPFGNVVVVALAASQYF